MPGLSIVTRPEERAGERDLHEVQRVLALLEGARGPRAEEGPLLCDLAYATADLATGARRRAVVRIMASRDPWELGLERNGRDVLVTVFRGGPQPQVAVHERRFAGDVLGARLLAALAAGPVGRATPTNDDALYASPLLDPGCRLMPAASTSGLACAREHLAAALPFPDEAAAAQVAVAVDPTGEVSVVIAADVLIRPQPAPPKGAAVSRADLFPLLFRGKVRVSVGGHDHELTDVFVFLVAEQLVSIALDALDAWTRGRAFHRRIQVGGAVCGVRLDPRGAASVTLGAGRRANDARSETLTFPAVDVGAFITGVIAFGRALARGLVRRDRAQAQNLRLVALRSLVRELGERLRESTRDDSKINAAPHTYRAFAATPAPPKAGFDAFGHARLRFSAKWMATIPSIDLRATFLCGDALLVGSAGQTSCLHRATGEIVWQRAMTRAVSVMTPAGLARLEPDGTLSLHEIASGDVAWQLPLAPRVGTQASGAVIGAPGLPRTLIVSEGARHLCAVDLDAGEVRWRFAARRSHAFRLRRAGKLVVVASGEPALQALDVLTGEIVWRFCDKLRFSAHVAADHDALFAVAGHGALVDRGGTRLHHIDPWSGQGRWSVDLPAHATPIGAPLLTQDTVIVVAQGREGTGLIGFDRRTGERRFERDATGSAASCLVVDDLVIVNGEAGELVGIDARDGQLRYRHVFTGGVEGDRPRRLEPVLRSGALFVPQRDVHVVRPRDGVVLGQLEADLIPDLLRVDDKCHVYVAEESGHLAAYAATPRLALVKK